MGDPVNDFAGVRLRGRKTIYGYIAALARKNDGRSATHAGVARDDQGLAPL
jgi:hypothetical protein